MNEPHDIHDDLVDDLDAGTRAKKLGIFGSRYLRDERVKIIILEELDACGADTIVTTQEPLGVCTVAQNIAKTEHYILELHFLNFHYRAGAFEHRSDAVIAASDRILLIHDGVSKGTANELKRVELAGKQYKYVTLRPEPDIKPIDYKLDSFVAFKTDNANADDMIFDPAVWRID